MGNKYQISIWRDIPAVFPETDYTFIDEERVAVIGSDTMTSQMRARSPQLQRNINGTNTFSFMMYKTYIDLKTGEERENLFLPLITNETKIKVFWQDKWYDFVVKNIQERSANNGFQYTCSDLNMIELSKTGFNLEFDAELNNNQGTVYELAEKVLDGSEWQLIDESQRETIIQEIEEPVFEVLGVEVPNQFTAYNPQHEAVTIAANSKLLIYYSVFRDRSTYLQFFYNEGGEYYKDSSDLLTEDGLCMYVKDVTWAEDGDYITCTAAGAQILRIYKNKEISTNYRAKRLVYSKQSLFDAVTEKYVDVYDYTNEDGEKLTVYGYIDDDYIDPTYVQNLIVNGEDFAGIDGWTATGSADLPIFQLYPEFTTVESDSESYMRFGHGYYYNAALQTSTAALSEGFQPNEQYVLRLQPYSDSGGHPGSFLTDVTRPAFQGWLGSYDKDYNPNTADQYFTFSEFELETDREGETWWRTVATCTKSATHLDIARGNVGLFLYNPNGSPYWLKKAQFFPLVYGEAQDGTIQQIDPGEFDTLAIVRQVYKYYSPNENTAASSIDDIKFLYVGYEPWDDPNLVALYRENFEKVRSITGKNSNRFNLIQSLAEIFECWARFDIERDEHGKVITSWDEENQLVKYHKYVSFVQNIGTFIGYGFKYGIDLNEIQRVINSDQIATKVIVPANSNEFGQNGFCTIARSQQNYIRDTFILNFDYFISHGLVNGAELNRDLYLVADDSIGYYYNLHNNNVQYDKITEEMTLKANDLLKQEAYLTTYTEYCSAAMQQRDNAWSNLCNYTGSTDEAGVNAYLSLYPKDEKANEFLADYKNCLKQYDTYSDQRDRLQASVDKLRSIIDEYTEQQKAINEKNDELHRRFSNKYGRYIQEGSWLSEEYMDDDLYYMDAVSVAYTSSRPQISYNISVLRLSALEKFKNKVFNLGDISYVEDTEFFGYINGTPYREQVLISEIIYNFDDPTQDKITVQNYKTQFEDLFQRITATTQSLQFAQGGYNKASGAFDEEGNLTIETLQNSISINQNLVLSAQNENIVSDSTGITLTDLDNPNNKTKITSGGVFITVDGGVTWKNAIRGEGLSTQYLTAGSINANYINIIDGANTSFRWDHRGINAFSTSQDDTGKVLMVNLGKFVRFDKYGIYGIDGETDFAPSDDNGEQDIWDTAQFGMTWRGFFMKNRSNNGYIEVSNEKDISIYSGVGDAAIDRIKIGRIRGDGTETNPFVYGIRIKDGEGDAVLETVADGSLWLEKNLNISSTDDNYSIQLGYLDLKAEENLHRTIDINDNFIVWEDGSMRAKNGTFSGKIEAAGTTIGNLTVEQLIGNGTRFDLISSEGTVVDVTTTQTILSAHAYRGEQDVTDQFVYTWFVDGTNVGVGQTYTLDILKDITEVYFEATEI